jgi:hypothetical protein
MKTKLALTLALLTIIYRPAEAVEKKLLTFVEIKSFSEGKSLPPQLMLSYEIFCNQRFVGVLRNDEVDPRSKKTTIAVGILVELDPDSTCGGVGQMRTAEAGPTFSGRAYEVIPIRK